MEKSANGLFILKNGIKIVTICLRFNTSKQKLTSHSPSGGAEQGRAAVASGSTRLRVRRVGSDCPSLDSRKRLRTGKIGERES